MLVLPDTCVRSIVHQQHGGLSPISKSLSIAPRARKSVILAQRTDTAPPATGDGRTEMQAVSKALIGRKGTSAQYAEQAYLAARSRRIAQHFPTAIGVDDFLNRLEIALFAYGFTGDNSIGTSHPHCFLRAALDGTNASFLHM